MFFPKQPAQHITIPTPGRSDAHHVEKTDASSFRARLVSEAYRHTLPELRVPRQHQALEALSHDNIFRQLRDSFVREESSNAVSKPQEGPEHPLVAQLKNNFAHLGAQLQSTIFDKLRKIHTELSEKAAAMANEDEQVLLQVQSLNEKLSQPLSLSRTHFQAVDPNTGSSSLVDENISLGNEVTRFKTELEALEEELERQWASWDAEQEEVEEALRSLLQGSSSDTVVTTQAELEDRMRDFRDEMEKISAETMAAMEANEEEFKSLANQQAVKLFDQVMTTG